MTERVEPVEVQWYATAGVGVRNFNLSGISKVHLFIPGDWPERTLCFVPVPRKSRRITPEADAPRCKRCIQANR